MRNLSDINDLYNFQDTIMPCEIFESRTSLMLEIYGFNPWRCNSASTLSCCIQRTLPKVITVLPTDGETVERPEKALIGGFGCVNTCLAFDTNILMPNVKPDLANEFQERKRKDLKIVYSLKLSDDVKVR